MVEVIGAGFGRTGTASVKQALEMLGFAPCHHMLEVLSDPPTAAGWVAALHGDRDALRARLAGYRAVVDFPGALLWREMMELYPDAKVLLTVRDAKKWYDSARATILDPNRGGRIAKLVDAGGGAAVVDFMAPLAAAMATRGFRRDLSEEDLIAVYERHNAAVRADVPADRLLVYRVGEGWAPLCEFFGVAVPAEPFPRVNESGRFHENVAQVLRTGLADIE